MSTLHALRLGSAGLLALALLSCGGGSSGGQSGVPGEVIGPENFSYPPGVSVSPAGFTVDPNDGGDAQELHLVQAYWGRLVDVYDFDSSTGESSLRNADYVIGEDVQSDGVDLLLETNPATNQVRVTILHAAGTPEYASAFAALDDGLGPVLPKSLDPQTLPPFSLLPRNAALVLQFDDLLEHASVNSGTVRLATGYPPTNPQGTRILLDPNHGGLIEVAGGSEFRTTRVILDLTISEFESVGSSPALAVNSLGLPASLTTAASNVALRLPTSVDFSSGVFQVLTNVSSHKLSLSNNGPVDFSAPSLDVVRALRSGGAQAVTGDTNNGFLFDNRAPKLVGEQTVSITGLSPDPANGEDAYVLNLLFQTLACARTPQVGDVIQQPGIFAQVTTPSTTPIAGFVGNVRVELLAGEASAFTNGQGVYVGAFDPAIDNAACFVSFTPDAASLPVASVDPSATVSLRFDEPMEPGSMGPLDNFRVQRVSSAPSLTQIVPCSLGNSPDLRSFFLQPVLPLNHVNGTSESFFLHLGSGEEAPTDLAGNALEDLFPVVSFTLDAAAPTAREGSQVLRFSSTDEDGNGFPEVRGQYVLDAEAGLLRPRSVSRFALVSDRQAPVPAFMTSNAFGVSEPLSKFGSRLMSQWRYVDFGLPGIDEFLYNLDIEGVNFAPLAGNVTTEFFEKYEMRLAHSFFYPDEAFDPLTLAPLFPASGLASTSFTENVLGDVATNQTVVHDKDLDQGYLLSALDAFISQTGTPMAPFPMNEGKALSDYSHFTWRDTAVTDVGGPNLNIDPGLGPIGVDPKVLNINMGVEALQVATTDFIPTIALPLLLEFLGTPSDSAQGTNRLDASFAGPGATRAPLFRVFSSGGTDTTGAVFQKVPELETVPSGGFNNTNNAAFGANGAPTPPGDDLWTPGQIDCVVRISRAHTIWFNTGVATVGFPTFAEPLMFPSAQDQPAGTSVVLAYRNVSAPLTGKFISDAGCFDVYGDRAAGNAVGGECPNPDSFDDPSQKNDGTSIDEQGWVDSISGISGANGRQFFQVRISFLSNTATGLTATLSGLGFSFTRP